MSLKPDFTLAPAAALQELRDGNSRFLTGGARRPRSSFEHLRHTAEHGQRPLAAIIGCSDARVPLELLFDQGFGDLFVVRIAGNTCHPSVIGSVEYAVGYLAAPLVLILAHTHCGAITAAATGLDASGAIPQLIAPIAPVLAEVQARHPSLHGFELVPPVTEANMWRAVADMLTQSALVAGFVRAGQVQVEAALCDIATGVVRFHGPHPRQAELLG